MSTAILSEQGQIEIPQQIREQLGLEPGAELTIELVGNVVEISQTRQVKESRPEDGYGMLVCRKPGPRSLMDFDVAMAMRQSQHDCH
jgi:AbrB family looped-hinge helix DNA binding protein